jgi:membrane associated rhomboid family serine protease
MLPLRDDQPSYSTPYVTYFLIGLNLVIFFFEWALDPQDLANLVSQFGVVPSRLTAFLAGSPKYPLIAVIVPYFTSMFLHEGWMHVIGNMWYLFIFGDNVEDYLGHFKYLVFYLLCGVIAMMAQVVSDPQSQVPALGASGAIAGVLGAYFVLYPRARVLTWFPPIFLFYLSAWVTLGLWFVYQFLSGAAALEITRTGKHMGGVAFWAHVGGFVAGMILIKVFPARSRRSPYAWQ